MISDIINCLLNRGKSSDDVALRELKSALTADEYLEFDEIWKDEKEKHAEPKPPEIFKYELLLKKAVLADSKMNSYSNKIYKRSEDVIKKLKRSVDVTFECALEYLQELQSTKSYLWV